MCSASHLSRYGRYARAALIDADPELHTRPRFNGCVSFGHFLLHREHASDPTPKPSLDVSMMLPPYFATVWQGSRPGDALRSRTVARGDVGCEDRCQFAGNLWTSRNIRHPGNQFDQMRPRLA